MSQLRPALILLLLLTLVTGVAYPLLTTALAQWLLPLPANGSLIEVAGETRGSAAIGQNFTRADYFHGRPSAAGDAPYNALASSGSNLAASNPALDQAIAGRAQALHAQNPQAQGAIPVDLLTASASGLDPQISPAAAYWQVPRIAKARGMTPQQVTLLVDQHIQRPLLKFAGEATVNVLMLNLALQQSNATP